MEDNMTLPKPEELARQVIENMTGMPWEDEEHSRGELEIVASQGKIEEEGVIDDKIVGALWREYSPHNPTYVGIPIRNVRHVKDLIRKLVEERICSLYQGYTRKEQLAKARHDFGISKSEWEAK